MLGSLAAWDESQIFAALHPGCEAASATRFVDYDIDYLSHLCYAPAILAHEGRLLETILRRSGEWRPAAAARNRRTREVGDPARQALRPGCEVLAARIRRKCRRWKRGPRPKIATVERREASVPPLRGAPRLARRGGSRLASATKDIVRLSALRPPLVRGGCEREKQNPGAETRRGEDCAV
jgi:hypothetical protein